MYNFLIIDDHTIVRTGIKLLIKTIPLAGVFNEAAEGSEALIQFKLKKYDLVILDLNLPNTNPSNLISEFLVIDPTVKILIFSMNNENIYAKELLKQGVMGFVSKDNCDETIKTAILKILSNKKYLSENLINQFLFNKNGIELNDENPFSKLSIKELEVVKLISEGLGSKDISNIMGVKINTVSTTKSRIFEKLNINNTAGLIEWYKLNNRK